MRKLIFCLVVVSFLAGEALALEITLTPVGTYETGIFDDKGAQIVDYHAPSQRLFITNASEETIDVLDILDFTSPILMFQIELSGPPLSVAVHPTLDLIAVAIEGEDVTDPGTVEFFNIDGESLGDAIEVGSLPDMITWTPDGKKLLVANEAEPSDDYTVDPEGSVSIITLGSTGTLEDMVGDAVEVKAEFVAFNGQEDELHEDGIRIFGPDASVAQDLEPEYIAVSQDSKTAWVTLQENNALAVVDIDAAEVTAIVGLGYKNHRLWGNGLDASNKDGEINIANWPVRGMYQPDAIAAFTVEGKQYLITGNEGDARDYDGFSEETRVGKVTLGQGLLHSYPDVDDKANLGRLKITKSPPTGKVARGNGKVFYNQLYCYGGRSFSIWNAEGTQVFDSGDQFEQITAAKIPEFFNSTDDENEFDDRSDDKGPEPEHVVVGKVGESTIAFIGLERIGGIMVYDVSDPYNPRFLDYVNNRDFEADPELAGDLGTEGLIFIPADKSPMDQALVVAANEVSGTTTIFIVVTKGVEP